MMRLHHAGMWGHSAPVLLLLDELGLGVQEVTVDLAQYGQLSDDFLGLNRAGQVPVLEADGAMLRESFFILQYLDERHGEGRLGGADPQEHYRVHSWGKYVETHVAPNLAIVRWAQRGTRPDAQVVERMKLLAPERRDLWLQALAGFSAEAVAAARAALVKAEARMAADITEHGWLAGKACSLADLAAFPHAAQFAGLDIPVSPQTGEWLGVMAARPSLVARGGLAPAVATMGPERGRWG